MSPPVRYSFVNARPETKAEVKQTRTAIRSHIGRWTQEKQQKLDENAANANEEDPSPKSARIASPSAVSLGRTKPRPAEKTTSIRSDRSDDLTQRRSFRRIPADDEVDGKVAPAVNVPAQVRRRPPFFVEDDFNTSVQVLGSGTLDPFRTTPTTFPADLVSQCHEYCKHVHPLERHCSMQDLEADKRDRSEGSVAGLNTPGRCKHRCCGQPSLVPNGTHR